MECLLDAYQSCLENFEDVEKKNNEQENVPRKDKLHKLLPNTKREIYELCNSVLKSNPIPENISAVVKEYLPLADELNDSKYQPLLLSKKPFGGRSPLQRLVLAHIAINKLFSSSSVPSAKLFVIVTEVAKFLIGLNTSWCVAKNHLHLLLLLKALQNQL